MAEGYRKRLTKIQAQDVPIDIKPVNPPDIFSSEPQEPKQLFWVRARGYIGGSCWVQVPPKARGSTAATEWAGRAVIRGLPVPQPGHFKAVIWV